MTFARHLLGSLASYMAWADTTVWKRILESPVAAEDARLLDTFHHVHLVQHVFRQAWAGEALRIRERREFARPHDLMAWGREAHGTIAAFLDRSTDDDLDREFRVQWASHFEERATQPAGAHTLGETALQVFLHTQHHRGQLCGRLRELAVEPPTIDFIVWLWSGRPASA